LSDKAKKRIAILAHRMRLISEDDFGDRVSIEWSQAIGKQLVVQVVEEEYDAKDGKKAKRAKLSFAGFWGLDDDRVKDVPRDQAAQRQATAARKPAATKATSKSKEDDWGSI
jgi:hypothetical protein